MNKKENKQGRARLVLMLGLTCVGLVLLTAGCGRSESSADETEITMPRPTRDGATAPTAIIPAPDIPEDSPVLSDVYPTLPGGALRHARLTELPEGVLLQAEGISLTQRDLDGELEEAPPQMREQLRKNAFFVLEQMATEKLLFKDAERSGVTGIDQTARIQSLFKTITSDAIVSETEIKAFYDANKDMIGGASFDQIKPRIREHLLQEKRQELVKTYIEETGLRSPVAVSASWTEEQAKLAMDNVVEKARASGKPSFVSFGADACRPCQMMAPFREEISSKYGDKLNVVYVHVNKEQFLASRYGVQGIPHIIFFDTNGKEFYVQSGFMSLEKIEEQLRNMGVKSE